MLSHKMSIEDKILQLLLEPKYKYKGMPVSALGIPIFFSYHPQSIRNAISRLAKKGSIERNGSDKIMIRTEGSTYVQLNASKFKFFERRKIRSNFSKLLLVLFDIPEDRKSLREWFRRQLQEFGYEMVQKSAWVGRGPLPKEFIAYCEALGLKDYVKVFSLSKEDKGIL